MKQPRFKGNHCATRRNAECPHLYPCGKLSVCDKYDPSFFLFRAHADPNYTSIRHPDCIAEFGMTNESPWTKEPPTEPGWYCVIMEHTGIKACLLSPNTEIAHMVLYWGPRINFPEPPKGDDQ